MGMMACGWFPFLVPRKKHTRLPEYLVPKAFNPFWSVPGPLAVDDRHGYLG